MPNKNDIYLALLRGINVGGKNKVKMADLKACFEKLGYGHVHTYGNSGNIIFTAASTDPVSSNLTWKKHSPRTFPAPLVSSYVASMT